MPSARLELWMGRVVPTPVSAAIINAVDRVEVRQKSQGRSAFQLSLLVQRRAFPEDDYALLAGPFSPLDPTTRVIVMAEVNGFRNVLIDGFVTHQQLAPSGGRDGMAHITLMGEDVSVRMDLDESSREFPAMPPYAIAAFIVLTYPELGLKPLPIPPIPPYPPPNPLVEVPLQHGTDYAYLNQLAAEYGYVFRVQPTPLPTVNVAYWGPDIRVGVLPQPALTVAQASATNVDEMNFTYDVMQPFAIGGRVLDGLLNRQFPIQTALIPSDPYAKRPPVLVQAPNFWRLQLRKFVVGGNLPEALTRAQITTTLSQQTVVQATGRLDPFRYGQLLRCYESVTVRGAGNTYDGVYFVQELTTTIERGGMKQNFVLTRGGLGTWLEEVPFGF
ncbi:MAG: hypothetical protein U0414_16935 [Polyangiaceae bacterium]